VPTTFGLPNTTIGAEEAERRAIEPAIQRKEVPTFKKSSRTSDGGRCRSS